MTLYSATRKMRRYHVVLRTLQLYSETSAWLHITNFEQEVTLVLKKTSFKDAEDLCLERNYDCIATFAEP